MQPVSLASEVPPEVCVALGEENMYLLKSSSVEGNEAHHMSINS